MARVGGRADEASDATAEVVRRQLDYDLGRVSWSRIDAGDGLAGVAEAAWECLRKPAPRAIPRGATTAGRRRRNGRPAAPKRLVPSRLQEQ